MLSAMNSAEIIDKLGGTAEVARLCEVQMPSVSEWKTNGIPKARLMFLRAVRPDVFQAGSAEEAEAPQAA